MLISASTDAIALHSGRDSPQNVDRSVVIAILNMATRFAFKSTNRERHLLSMPAFAASLRSVARVYSMKLPSSVFSFGLSDRKELAPCYVGNTFGEMVVFDHPLDVQRLDCNHVEVLNQSATNFVVEVPARVRHSFMYPRNYVSGLCSVRATSLLSRETALRLRETMRVLRQMVRVADLAAVAECRKVGETNVDPHALTCRGQRPRARDIAHEQGIPTARPARNAELLDLAFNWTRETNTARTHAGDCQTVAVKRAFSPRLKFLVDRIVAVASFESWKSDLDAFLFQSTKECLKRKFKPFKRVLLNSAQTFASVGDLSAGLGELARLLIKAQQLAALLVVRNSLFKGAVVNEASIIQRSLTRLYKLVINPQLVGKSLCDNIWLGHAARVQPRWFDRAQSFRDGWATCILQQVLMF